MSGALLRSGSLRDFFALGAVGYPVYQSATQLRVAMRSQIDVEVADTFAIPKRNDSGNTIDWYAPFDGPVIPWTSATPDERADALLALQAMRERVLSAGQRLQAESDSERQVFGRLLQHVMSFPDDQHVYLVDGKPVLTFWGFRRHDAPAAVDSLALLATAERAVAPVNVEPVAVTEMVKSRRWPWWLWLLLLLLLLIPLLFWYRSCSELPAFHPPSIEPTKPRTDLPGETHKPVEQRPIYTEQRPVEAVPGGAGGLPTGAANAIPEDQPASEEAAPLPETAEDVPPESPSEEEQPPAEQAPDEPPMPPQPEMPPVEDPPLPPTPEMPPAAGESDADAPPLQIPPEALQQGSTDFLNGRWNSNSGLIDETGRPVQLEYEFNNGQGSVSLRRSDGSVCRGNISASIAQQRLVISDKEQITCPDGQFFEPSTVDCSVGSTGRAECNGRYATGGAFPVEMRQAK